MMEEAMGSIDYTLSLIKQIKEQIDRVKQSRMLDLKMRDWAGFETLLKFEFMQGNLGGVSDQLLQQMLARLRHEADHGIDAVFRIRSHSSSTLLHILYSSREALWNDSLPSNSELFHLARKTCREMDRQHFPEHKPHSDPSLLFELMSIEVVDGNEVNKFPADQTDQHQQQWEHSAIALLPENMRRPQAAAAAASSSAALPSSVSSSSAAAAAAATRQFIPIYDKEEHHATMYDTFKSINQRVDTMVQALREEIEKENLTPWQKQNRLEDLSRVRLEEGKKLIMQWALKDIAWQHNLSLTREDRTSHQWYYSADRQQPLPKMLEWMAKYEAKQQIRLEITEKLNQQREAVQRATQPARREIIPIDDDEAAGATSSSSAAAAAAVAPPVLPPLERSPSPVLLPRLQSQQQPTHSRHESSTDLFTSQDFVNITPQIQANYQRNLRPAQPVASSVDQGFSVHFADTPSSRQSGAAASARQDSADSRVGNLIPLQSARPVSANTRRTVDSGIHQLLQATAVREQPTEQAPSKTKKTKKTKKKKNKPTAQDDDDDGKNKKQRTVPAATAAAAFTAQGMSLYVPPVMTAHPLHPSLIATMQPIRAPRPPSPPAAAFSTPAAAAASSISAAAANTSSPQLWAARRFGFPSRSVDAAAAAAASSSSAMVVRPRIREQDLPPFRQPPISVNPPRLQQLFGVGQRLAIWKLPCRDNEDGRFVDKFETTIFDKDTVSQEEIVDSINSADTAWMQHHGIKIPTTLTLQDAETVARQRLYTGPPVEVFHAGDMGCFAIIYRRVRDRQSSNSGRLVDSPCTIQFTFAHFKDKAERSQPLNKNSFLLGYQAEKNEDRCGMVYLNELPESLIASSDNYNFPVYMHPADPFPEFHKFVAGGDFWWKSQMKHLLNLVAAIAACDEEMFVHVTVSYIMSDGMSHELCYNMDLPPERALLLVTYGLSKQRWEKLPFGRIDRSKPMRAVLCARYMPLRRLRWMEGKFSCSTPSTGSVPGPPAFFRFSTDVRIVETQDNNSNNRVQDSVALNFVSRIMKYSTESFDVDDKEKAKHWPRSSQFHTDTSTIRKFIEYSHSLPAQLRSLAVYMELMDFMSFENV
jgi:hypothetical protein